MSDVDGKEGSEEPEVLSDASPILERNPYRDGASYLFKYIFLTQGLLYLECGAVPAVLHDLKGHFDLNFALAGALGGSLYVFLGLACPCAGYLLHHFNPRSVLGVSICVNNAALIVFAACPNHLPYLLIGSRCVVGFTQAFVMIYAPVWVDEFAPDDRRTTWMSFLQASVPLSLVVGYAIGAGVLTASGGCFLECWRIPFAVQALLVLPLCIGIWFVPSRHMRMHVWTAKEFWKMQVRLNIKNSEGMLEQGGSTSYGSVPEGVATGADGEPPTPTLVALRGRPLPAKLPPLSINSAFLTRKGAGGVQERRDISQVWTLIMTPVYIYVVMSLSALYFVVTGIQFWVTDYILTTMHVDEGLVNTLFIACCLTGPLFGVFVGGWIIDRAGGYRGDHQRYAALLYCAAFGVLAVSCSMGAAFATKLPVLIACIWGVLFGGGALLPAATGIYISAVPVDLRAFASAVSVTVFNIFGYALAPLLSSLVMQLTDSYTWGFRLVMLWSWLSLLFLLGALVHAKINLPKGSEGPSGMQMT